MKHCTVFVGVGTHQLKKYENAAVSVIAGTGQAGVRDGKGETATFLKATSICSEYESLFMADAQAETIRLLMSGQAMSRFLNHMGMIYKAFNRHLRQVQIHDETLEYNKLLDCRRPREPGAVLKFTRIAIYDK